jgi:hypothetical protein
MDSSRKFAMELLRAIVADYISRGYWEFEFSLTEEAIRQKLTRAQIVKDFYAQKA